MLGEVIFRVVRRGIGWTSVQGSSGGTRSIDDGDGASCGADVSDAIPAGDGGGEEIVLTTELPAIATWVSFASS